MLEFVGHLGPLVVASRREDFSRRVSWLFTIANASPPTRLQDGASHGVVQRNRRLCSF